MISRFDQVPAQEFRRRHAPAPLLLDLEEAQTEFRSYNGDLFSIDLHLPGYPGDRLRKHARPIDLQDLTVVLCECRRVRRESANEIVDPACRLVPLNTAVVFKDFWRPGGQRAILAQYCRFAVLNPVHRLKDDFGTKYGKSIMNRPGVVFRTDRDTALKDHPAGIDLIFQQERRYAGYLLPVDDRPVDRRRSAVFRQK